MTITVTDVNDHNPEVDVSSVDVVVGRLQGAHVHTIHVSITIYNQLKIVSKG